MASVRLCDSCKKEITEANPVVTKLFLTPVKPGTARAGHGDYSAHADVGQCCAKKMLEMVKWQKRVSGKAKSNGRKLRPTNPV
jgi:hypothetical protein